jgi:hypothetical protein
MERLFLFIVSLTKGMRRSFPWIVDISVSVNDVHELVYFIFGFWNLNLGDLSQCMECNMS